MLSPEIRKAIYGVLAAVLALASIYQVVDDSQSAAILDVADQILAALALVLAYRNVKPTPVAGGSKQLQIEVHGDPAKIAEALRDFDITRRDR